MPKKTVDLWLKAVDPGCGCVRAFRQFPVAFNQGESPDLDECVRFVMTCLRQNLLVESCEMPEARKFWANVGPRQRAGICQCPGKNQRELELGTNQLFDQARLKARELLKKLL